MTKNALIRGQGIATALREDLRKMRVNLITFGSPKYEKAKARLDVIRHAVECEAGHDLHFAPDGNHVCPCDQNFWSRQCLAQ